MLRRSLFPLLIIVLLLTLTSSASAGGWSVATLDTLPGCVVAETPLTVGFVVRQHGINVLEDLNPEILATHGESGETVTVIAEEDTDGHYTAELTFPADGEWEWILAAFGPEQPMPALTVLPAGETCPDEDEDVVLTADELAEQGADLFAAKGCVVCHQHDRSIFDAYASINAGPELTTYHGDADFLCRWLDNPAALNTKAAMPDLDLTGEEIEALIAYLNAGSDQEAPTDAGWCGDLLTSAAAR